MAKGFLITPEVETLIVSTYHCNPKRKPREVRMVVRNILLGKSKERPELLPKLKAEWPSLSSVRGKIKKAKLSGANPDSKDKPWSMAALGDYPIPADAMPTVMSIYKRVLAGDRELTIREVQWIARLYRIFDDLDLIWDWAWQYAMSEWVDEISHKPFDTTELDLELVRNPQYAQESRRDTERAIAIWGIAERLHPDFRGPGTDFDALLSAVGADFNALMELNLSIEETEEIAKSGKYKKEAQDERKHKTKKQA